MTILDTIKQFFTPPSLVIEGTGIIPSFTSTSSLAPSGAFFNPHTDDLDFKTEEGRRLFYKLSDIDCYTY